MRPARWLACLLAIIPAFAAHAADATPAAAADDGATTVTTQTVTMSDGRSIVGNYDPDHLTITLINEKTGKAMGEMPVKAGDVTATADLVLTVHRTAVVPAGTNGHFISNYKTALASAKATRRPILIDFTGSDWCPWCKKLDQEVFATKAFTAWAAAHVVLLEADFPRQTAQAPSLAKQNHDLAATWSITGYPTVIVTDAAGATRLAESGYIAGGAQHWLDDLQARLKAAER